VGHTVGLIHAVIPAIEPVKTAFGQLAPDIKVVNILDEGLLTEIERRGSITPGLVRAADPERRPGRGRWRRAGAR